MDRPQIEQHEKLSARSADREIDPQKQESEQWNHKQQETDQLNNLSYGNESKLTNGIPANDGSRDEARPPTDAPINPNEPSHHHCHHRHHESNKAKESYVPVDNTPKEIPIIRSIRPVPITIARKPFNPSPNSNLRNAGTARAYIAASQQNPSGTTHNDWARTHSHQTVLQQHCDFFDTDHDAIIWPQDTFTGFHKLGFGLILSLVAVVIIHANFSYPTLSSWIPDPFFRIYIANIHRDKHGSDSGTYDHEGRFVPQKFEDIFEKYAEGREYVTIWDVSNMMKGQRCIADPIGWGGAFFEWIATWLMLWPEDGRMMKEDIRGIYDGSLFYKIAARRASNKAYGYE